MARRARRLASAVAAAAALSLGAGAEARAADSALGLPCIETAGARSCIGSVATLVPSWDGVPLDADVYLPPASTPGPYPLIVAMHGFGVTKLLAFSNEGTAAGTTLKALDYARQGYAVLAYSARGIGFSCGLAVVRDAIAACDKGWTHLADARFEIRDTQYLAGKLVDEGLVEPTRIGVTGDSYGGGQSLMLATLRNRMMLEDGSLVPWTSPAGVAMEIAAAAPKIGWSDLAQALVPTGRTLDYKASNPYGHSPGIVKKSYLDALFAVAEIGYIAPPGADSQSDIYNWKGALDTGPPYDPGFVANLLGLFKRYHSAYSLQNFIPRSERIPPAPTVIYNGFYDDIMPAQEALRYEAHVRRQFGKKARVGMVLTSEYGHNRGSLVAEPKLMNIERDKLFERYLMGDKSVKPLRGVIAQTQPCGGAPLAGPFKTRRWRGQHPGEVRVGGGAPQTFTSAGGDPVVAALTDPFAAATGCAQTQAATDPGAATYMSAPAGAGGFTLIGSPTVTATLAIDGEYPQVDARLWDVAPDGSQTMVQHSSYLPRAKATPQTFQLLPAGWAFEPGHVAKLELLGRDTPYAQASNGQFSITVSDLELELPVHEAPDGAQVKRFAPPRRAR